MKRTVKRNFIIFILVVSLADTVIGYFLFKSRGFSHLAIWNITESNKKDDFYWQPENAPRYFYFEPHSEKTSIFRNEIYPLIVNKNDEFNIVLKVARYVMGICSNGNQHSLPLRWDSPERMLEQIKKGANSNCFHRAILFSTYLSSLGIKSRSWILENDNFNAVSHSVNEIYIPNLKKWVFMDIMFGFYAVEGNIPLSFLELRERLLTGKARDILACGIGDGINKQYNIPAFYTKLIKCVFLRAKNDFVNRYDRRYGIFSIFSKYIDMPNDNFRRGMEYLLGARDSFIHYTDRFSESLKIKITVIKISFYFFRLSIIIMPVILILLAYS